MSGQKEIALIALGAASLFMMKRSGKPSKTYSTPSGWNEDALLILDQECNSIAKKIDPVAHDTFITNRYRQLVSEGMTDTHKITIQILKDNSRHCPWDDESKWTDFMRSIYEQLFAGIEGYRASTSS